MLKFLTYCLLISVALVVTPKSYFHHHDHDFEMHDDNAPSFEEHCFVCDFDCSDLSTEVFRKLEYKAINFCSISDCRIISLKVGVRDSQLSRGPPQHS